MKLSVIGDSMNGRTFGELLASERMDYFYMMHLSYNGRDRERLWTYALRERIIGLDLPDIVTRDWVTLSEPDRERAGEHWIRQFDLFCKSTRPCIQMHEGDYVMILNGTYSLLGIARIAEPRHHYDQNLSDDENNPDPFFDHFRIVDWIKKYPYDGYHLPEKLTFDGTLERVTPRTRSPRWRVLTNIDP